MAESKVSTILRVKQIYEVVPSTDGLPHVRSGDEIILKVAGKKGMFLGQLLLAIDGKKSIEQLVNQYKSTMDQQSVLAAIQYLLQENILEEATPPAYPVPECLRQQLLYLSHYVTDPYAAMKNLADTQFLIVSDRDSTQTLVNDMIAHGISQNNLSNSLFQSVNLQKDDLEEVRQKVSLVDFVIVVLHGSLSSVCRKINHICLEQHTPVLFADLSSGEHGVVGPLCVSGQCSCYACYESRIIANNVAYQERADYEEYLPTQAFPTGSYGQLHALEQVVYSLIIIELMSYITSYRAPRTIDGTLNVNLFQPEIYREPVLKMPYCRACGHIRDKDSRDGIS